MPSLVRPIVECPAPGKPVGGADGPQGKVASSAHVDIIDIRRNTVEASLKEEIHSLFFPQEGPRKLPTMLLYDERGLQLFEKITYLEEYYLTNAEIQVLQRSAAAIANTVPSGTMMVELGSGNLRKVGLLLRAFEDAGKNIDYYALDLSEAELMRTLAQLPSFQHIRCHGLLGTYDDGREWLMSPSIAAKRKCVLHMGSSIGNFSPSEAAGFLRSFSEVLKPQDSMVLGVDSCTNPSKTHTHRVLLISSNFRNNADEEGITHAFVLNGLKNANEVLGEPVFKLDDWKVIGEYVYDIQGGRHQAFYSPVRDTVVMGETIRTHERIQVEQSFKYSKEGCDWLWRSAGLLEADRWMTDEEDYGLHLLMKNPLSFSLNPVEYARDSVPQMDDWTSLWAVWDAITQQMLPNEELLDKPIKLRNACIFYLGHIPTFLDIQLTKTTGDGPSSPAFYHSIFERGIDPDVDNPEHCHAHSEIPAEWPPVDEILAYQSRVRARLSKLYENGVQNIPRGIARAIWVGFEHEVMHMETLLYILLQSDKTLPPPGIPAPDFKSLARDAKLLRVENKWFDIPEQDVTLGMDDPENVEESETYFGWDNEKPARRVHVHSFQAKGRPITNEEYGRYLYETKADNIPASWATKQDSSPHNNGGGSNGHDQFTRDESGLPDSFVREKFVRTVYGLVPLKYALDWPVFASYDELNGCAAWMGGRIPTLEEARSIYKHVEVMKRKEAERQLGATVPAVNGHLVNDGVEETPPSPPYSSSVVDDTSSSSSSSSWGCSRSREDLFIDLAGANVGFQNWHPVPVTDKEKQLAGQADLGGVWEWTSSPLRKHEGFEPMSLYPLYTADFFDDKHNVVLGGSWATHPRIAGRKSFVNWYQRNYPYAWVGARLVRDIKKE
ncbi:C-type lectin protein [Poronia punctata]|nr:C-type lectin protein [Poronia punctata]